MCVELDSVLSMGPVHPLHICGHTKHKARLEIEMIFWVTLKNGLLWFATT